MMGRNNYNLRWWALGWLVFTSILSAQTLCKAEQAREEILVVTKHSKSYKFHVELAITKKDQLKGLMYRRSLQSNSGMLFLYSHPQYVSFWMKNTYIPLDLLFIDSRNIIAKIHEGAEPLSLAPISPNVLVIAVLELKGGTTSKLGITVGDSVIFPDLK